MRWEIRFNFVDVRPPLIEQRGRNAWIVKSSDVKAVLSGVDADELELDFTKGLIAFAEEF